jgi:hypothetical protein
LVFVATVAFGCGGASSRYLDAEAPTGSGGSSNPGVGGNLDAGGSIAAGGNVGSGGSGSGGSTGTGGRTTSSAGGATPAGGSTGTTSSGGMVATGGATSGTGGTASGGSTAVSTGGRGGTGGRATAGATGQGGAIDAGPVDAAGGTGGGTGGTATGGATGQGGAIDAGAITAGNPYGSCGTGVPARGAPVDTSTPTTKIGTGTPESCDFAQLETAATKGGIITFDCGPEPKTILVTATLDLPTNKDTVIDGGNRITLDGGGAVQLMRFDSPDWQRNTHGLTLQHLILQNGKTNPTEVIPEAPPPCSQGYNDGEGGAVYMRDGNLTVIDCIFLDNQAAPLGPDTGGGAIYINGSLNGVLIVGSTFIGNQASNAGAVGCLFAELDVYDSLFQDNQAIGHDANNNDPDQCSAINNGQNEIGSGGNGGALYSDGAAGKAADGSPIISNIVLCGDAILDNRAGQNAFGGGVFFTSNDYSGTLTLTDTTMTGNTGGHWTQVSGGSVTNAGTAVGTNCKSITITNSTVQK